MGELVYIWGLVGDIEGYRCCHWAATESYVVHMWVIVFWARDQGVVPVVGCNTDDLCDTEMGAMKAEGQARLELPINPGYKSVGSCMCGTERRAQGRRGQWGLYGRVRPEGVHRRGLTLFRCMRAALFLGCCSAPIGSALACCLMQCCYVAMPCPLTPGDPTGQRSSPLLMLKLCSCHCPQSMVGWYSWSFGSSVMLWATSGSPGTRGIEQGRNHLSVRDAR